MDKLGQQPALLKKMNDFQSYHNSLIDYLSI